MVLTLLTSTDTVEGLLTVLLLSVTISTKVSFVSAVTEGAVNIALQLY